jgi:hypothetical protein
MSDDENFTFIAYIVVILAMGVRRWKCILTVNRLAAPARARLAALAALAVPLACTIAVLALWSADDVRTAPEYFAYYLLMGGAWMALCGWVWELLGLSLRDDVLERRTATSPAVLVGAYTGTALCFAGANIGNGPGWWVVLFCASLSTVTLLALWLLLDAATSVGSRITVDGDPATGVRVTALLVAAGLILGRAAAGDWVSSAEAIVSFAGLCGPAVALFGMEAVVHRLAAPDPGEPSPSPIAWGVAPAAVTCAVAALSLAAAGPW